MSTPSIPARRLNPFLFPSDTDIRFFLLIAAVIGASIFAYNSLQVDLFANRVNQVSRECLAASSAAFPLDGLAPNTSEYAQQFRAQFFFEKVCRESFEKFQAFFIVAGIALLFIVAAVIYWLLPYWIIRRNRLMPFTAEDDLKIAAQLEELSREAGLKSPPVFLQNPVNGSRGGLAFGRMRRYYIVLNGGLVTQFYGAPARFRAVLRHELAHLRNGDIDKSYFAIAVGIAFFAVALFPLALSLFDNILGGEIALGFGLAWRALVFSAIVYLMLTAVLRTREVYADVRASVWGESHAALRELLQEPTRSQGFRTPPILDFHPNASDRVKTLDDTAGLFRFTSWNAIATGIIVSVALPEINAVLGLALNRESETLAPFGAALLFAPFAVGVIGLGIWRDVFARTARSEIMRGFGRLGIGLGIGMFIGLFLSLRAAVPLTGLGDWRNGLFSAVTFDLLWFGILLVSLFLFARWISGSAVVWFETVSTRRALNVTWLTGLFIAGAMLVVWLGFLFQLWIFQYDGMNILFEEVGFNEFLDFLVRSPLALLLLMSVWMYPLAARFWQKKEERVDGAYLEPNTPPLTIPSRIQFRFRTAFLIGIAMAVVCLALMALSRVTAHIALPDSVRLATQWRLAFRTSQSALAFLTQAGAAALAAIFIQWLGWAHGLFAAFVAGCVIVVGYLALIELGDCVSIFAVSDTAGCADIFDPDLAQFVFGAIVNWGLLWALPVALIAAALAGRLRHPSSI